MKKGIVLITGVSSGLGKHMSYSFVRKGWKVLGIARREAELLELKENLGDNFDFFVCDVTKQTQVKETAKLIYKKNLFPKIIILNAGIFESETNEVINTIKHKALFNTNYFGAVYFVEEWIKYFLENGGTFVVISSLLARQVVPYTGAYSASKSAISKYFESLRMQYYNSKVKFVTVFAGPMRESSAKFKVAFTKNYNESSEYITRKIIEGREIISFPFIYNILSYISKLIPIKIFNYFYNIFFNGRDK